MEKYFVILKDILIHLFKTARTTFDNSSLYSSDKSSSSWNSNQNQPEERNDLTKSLNLPQQRIILYLCDCKRHSKKFTFKDCSTDKCADNC